MHIILCHNKYKLANKNGISTFEIKYPRIMIKEHTL